MLSSLKIKKKKELLVQPKAILELNDATQYNLKPK